MFQLSFLEIIIAGSFFAAAAAFLGVFVVLRRMALVPDVLSHVALPGIALGLIFNFNPFWGALAFLFVAVFLVLGIESWTRLGTEAVIGIIFTAALAAGSLFMPEEELLEALFGDISNITRFDFWLSIMGGAATLIILLKYFKPMSRFFIAPELAQSEGMPTKKMHLIFLFMLVILVALGIKVMGVLLMGSLFILPAATAKNLSGSMRALFAGAVGISALAVILGFWSALSLAIPPGPAIILVNTALFVASLVVVKLINSMRQSVIQ